MKYFLSIPLIFFHIFCFSQVIDDFLDGNFNLNPSWQGSTTNFQINPSLQLQSVNTVAGTSFLTTPHQLLDINQKEWRFWIKLAFSPSANNYARVYLTSSNADFSIQPDGYYLQFGETGSLDAIRLFKQQNKVSSLICSGNAGNIATSFAIGVRVVRDAFGEWRLYVDESGGENYLFSSSGIDTTSLVGSYFGVQATYSVTNAAKFYFDRFYIGPKILDITPPSMINATVITTNQVDVLFSEPLDSLSASTFSNYSLSPANAITLARIDASNKSLVHLITQTAFVNGTTYSISGSVIKDLEGNSTTTTSSTFNYFVAEQPEYGDVIITEIMADPSPVIDLPEVEYIEIYNRSTKYFNLTNWKIGDESSFGMLSTKWLAPNQYVILAATSSLVSYPTAVAVSSFPSYNIAGDAVILKSTTGLIIDSLYYSDDWYKEEVKNDGGFSLERKKLKGLCSDKNNWCASISITGGTPNFQNSVFDSLADSTTPKILSINTLSSNSIEIIFDERIDATSLNNCITTTNPSLTFGTISSTSTFPSTIKLDFSTQIQPSTLYSILLTSISDCWQNTANLSSTFALPETATKGELWINELLFNPLTGGSDFVELYNSSNKIIDLNTLSFANFSNGAISSFTPISTHFLVPPKGYAVVTKDTTFLKKNYTSINPNYFIQNDLPAYNNDSSTVLLMTNATILDQVSYSENWHFKLIEDVKGKSLERISCNLSSNDSTNWHTAAETVGFATPGIQNSQVAKGQYIGDFEFGHAVISPDNDGVDDVLEIHYQLSTLDMVGSVTIFDGQGRKVRKLVNNQLLASKGIFIWDGLSDDAIKATIGNYIAVFEVFSIDGKTQFAKKKAFVVAGKL